MNLNFIKKHYYGDIPDDSAGGNPTEITSEKQLPSSPNNWPLWEVFIRSKQGLDHKHAGSLHATDAAMAIENARDAYTRRQEGVSIWVVETKHLHASNPDDAASFFDPAEDKIYRYPTFYDLPNEVKHM